MFNRALTRLFWIAASLIGGPGVVVIGDPGADAPTGSDGRQRWHGLEGVALLAMALVVAFALGAPPAGIGAGAVIGLLIVLAGVARARR